MQLSGSKDFPTSPMDTYQLLTDPDVLVKAMPGLKSMEATSEHSYKADIEVGVAGIKGRYDGSIEMRNVQPGQHYTLLVKGDGPMGFMEAEVAIRLAPKGDGTSVVYEGDAKVGGTVAGVGSRMLQGVAKLLINQFFNGIVKQARAQVQ